MTRDEIRQHNQNVIVLVISHIKKWQANRSHYKRYPIRTTRLGYKELVELLNASNIKTSRGSAWTIRALYRMMQRKSLRLHDIKLSSQI